MGAIILNISIKGGRFYSREVINRGTAIIRGNTVCIFIAHVSGGSSYNRVLAYRNNVVFT